MGAPMAARLARSGALTVWNRTRSRAEEFARVNRTRSAATPREAAAGADVVITCLPSSREVEALLVGPDGLLAGLAPGALLLDCTSGDPATSRRIAVELAGRRVAFADAPVSGGTNGAEAGTLTILAAGEALAAAVKAGVPARVALDVINVSSGRSFVSETLVPERVLTGAWPRTFRLALLEKDVGIARDLLRDTGIEGPVIDLAGELFGRARAALGESADYLDAIRLIESQGGVEIRG